jgi:hypothetical protein
MAQKQTTREWNIVHTKMARTSARKYNAPTRGLAKTLSDQNRPVIAALEAKARAARNSQS